MQNMMECGLWDIYIYAVKRINKAMYSATLSVITPMFCVGLMAQVYKEKFTSVDWPCSSNCLTRARMAVNEDDSMVYTTNLG